MSLSSKVYLATALTLSIGTIAYVHYKQQYDRDQLHKGVILDIERQQRRKAENLYRLQEQIEITKEFHKNNPNET